METKYSTKVPPSDPTKQDITRDHTEMKNWPSASELKEELSPTDLSLRKKKPFYCRINSWIRKTEIRIIV